ncbi:MAG: hypothetical protein JW871_06330 [Endomicrobiales bacterium]|nr:hypothetical protein [Endomicrobiales bacterium]
MPSLTFLITAGPTREFLDPIRFLSNASSGKMGYELACAVKKMGYRAILISGPTNIKPPKKIEFVSVTSAREMFLAAKKYFRKSDIIIGAAAVSDWRSLNVKKSKIKKGAGNLTLRLIENPDIMKYLGSRKKSRVVVGFALESRNIFNAARKKLKDKKLDLIVANYTEAVGLDRSSVWILKSNGGYIYLKNKSKKETAKRIVNEALRVWKNRRIN